MNPLDTVAKEQGFNDAKEMSEMVLKVDLTNLQYMGWFMAWKEADGTKQGLITLFGENYFNKETK